MERSRVKEAALVASLPERTGGHCPTRRARPEKGSLMTQPSVRYFLRCLSHGGEFDESYGDPPVPRACPKASSDAACEVEIRRANVETVGRAVAARLDPSSLEDLRNLESWAVHLASTVQTTSPAAPWGNVQMLMRAAAVGRELRAARYALERVRMGIAYEARSLEIDETKVMALANYVTRALRDETKATQPGGEKASVVINRCHNPKCHHDLTDHFEGACQIAECACARFVWLETGP